MHIERDARLAAATKPRDEEKIIDWQRYGRAAMPKVQFLPGVSLSLIIQVSIY